MMSPMHSVAKRALGAALALSLAAPAAAATRADGRRRLAIAAAASVRPALEPLARAFEAARPGAEVLATYGASGTFFAQIRGGAPFDLFVSADRDYPQRLVEAGLGQDEVAYARGALALWVPRGSRAPIERDGLAALTDPAVRRIAIANPAVAPYGRVAAAALRAAGIEPAVRRKLVLGESVAQAAQFADTGAADAALIPLPTVLGTALAGKGRHVRVSADLAPPLLQSAVVLSRAREPELARAFLAFLRGETARAILLGAGYALP
jgi:molybdate transport system substrate-binding protein